MNQILHKIQQRIKQIPKVSAAPSTLITKLAQENFEIREIVDIIETDVSLTGRCLQIVNSAAFGLRYEISSIKQATVLLGSHTLISIALVQGFKDVLMKPLKGYAADRLEYWNHSLRTAVASKIIAPQISQTVKKDLCFTAGLLHDIGKLIISEFLAAKDLDVKNIMPADENQDFIEVEKSILNIDHTIVGEAMAKQWNFPAPLIEAIRFHHNPSSVASEYRDLTEIVHLSDLLAMLGGSGTGVDSLAYKMDPLTDKMLKVDRRDLAKLICEIDMQFLEYKNKYTGMVGEV